MELPCYERTKACSDEIFFYFTFHYHPSIESAITDIVVFSVVTLLMLGLNIMYGGGKFMHIIVITGMLEAIGYGLRILAAQQVSLNGFIVSTLFLLMSPIALAAVNYIVVGRLLQSTGKSIGWLKANWIGKLFVISDVVCFFIQGGGGGLLAIQDKAINDAGSAIVLIGLAIQTLFFSAFVWVTWYIGYSKSFRLIDNPKLTPVFRGLFGTIALLYIRNIYRFVEFSVGTNSYVTKNEWVFNIFETLPIFLAFLVYAYYHFGRLLSAAAKPVVVALDSAATIPSGDSNADSGNGNIDSPTRIAAAAAVSIVVAMRGNSHPEIELPQVARIEVV